MSVKKILTSLMKPRQSRRLCKTK